MKMIKRPVLLFLAVFLAGTGVQAGDGYAQTTSITVVQPSQRVYTYPEGQYELRGDGTANSPYYWVWIPIGTVSQTPAPRYQYQPDLKSAEGQIESVNAWTRRMTVDGEDFDLPDSFAMTNVPAVGQEVMVTYYVAQDGRNIVRSIDHSSAR